MLTFDAVTTYAVKHWDAYASRCVETFEQHWEGVPLLRYTDDSLEVSSEWLPEFKSRHAHRPTVNYRFDAVRFAHKVAAIELAYRVGEGDVLIWIDADCVTHAQVDSEWLCGLLGAADFGYLKRTKKYSETGFMMFRRGPACDRLIAGVVNLYRSDTLFDLAEWHDCWAIDHVRERIVINSVSLSGDAENTGHPLVNGPLGERLDHLKGKRKAVGKSLRTDLQRKRVETYWR